MELLRTAHIAFLCTRLDLPGGIERAIVNTANLFMEKGMTVSMIILDETAESFYPLHAGVRIIRQKLSFGITREGNVVSRKIRLLTDVLTLRKILKEVSAEIIIATEYPLSVAAILAGARKNAGVFSWEHHHFHELRRSNFWERLIHLAYPRLNGVICLNDDERNYYAKLNRKVYVVPNFIKAILHDEVADKSGPLILTVARLSPVKGIRLLLDTATIVLKQHPQWKWKIIGQGEMNDEVLAHIQQHQLGGRLLLQQPTSYEVDHEYRRAALYVLTSENECFPMTLLEAMTQGTPCIAIDCESGPRHIITHGVDGLLVKKRDPVQLAQAISNLLTEDQERNRMGKKARENIQRFSAENIFKLWANVFSEVRGSSER